MAWRKARVMFISKAGGRAVDSPKSYKTISVTLFFLKTMKKLIDLHIRGTKLTNNESRRYQFAYQTAKSTLSSLQRLT